MPEALESLCATYRKPTPTVGLVNPAVRIGNKNETLTVFPPSYKVPTINGPQAKEEVMVPDVAFPTATICQLMSGAFVAIGNASENPVARGICTTASVDTDTATIVINGTSYAIPCDGDWIVSAKPGNIQARHTNSTYISIRGRKKSP